MAKFFNYFPKTFYSSNTNNTNLETVTNIVTRFNFLEDIKQNSTIFYSYEIKDGDTPEIIASKMYDNPERHWIVMMFNNIIDPLYDWPLQYKTLIEYIDKKYEANNYADTANTSVTGLSWAMNENNVHSYYKVITRTNANQITIQEKLSVDSSVYANVTLSTQNITLQNGEVVTETIAKEKKTYYTYEMEKNESKRSIKILKKEFIPQIEKEFRRVYKL